MKQYANIRSRTLVWPASMGRPAKDLIDKLLTVKPSERLGCMATGSAAVLAHGWFKGLNFRSLEAKKIQPPFLPTTKDAKDLSNFEEEYTDENILFSSNDIDPKIFDDFASEWIAD